MDKRIIYLDLMRAFAVLMMVQGHTIDMLLSPEFRSADSIFYYGWNFMRGMTAPIFLFTAGTVFTYLYILQDKKSKENPRLIKGLKRFVLLVFLGYLLHYPAASIIDFSNVTPEQWKEFFAIDVLQLIGFGILFIIMILIISEKLKIKPTYLFIIAGFLFVYLNPIIQNINWQEYLSIQIAGYFYTKTGSSFPLFPWCSYLFFGGFLGYYLAMNKGVQRKPRFVIILFAIGAIFILSSFIGDRIEIAFRGSSDFWGNSPNLVLYRIGVVIILNSVVSLIAFKMNNIPKIIIQVGQHTLSIYFIHLIILYGSAWNLGLKYLLGESFNILESIITAILMIILMIGMVISVRMIKLKSNVNLN